MTPSRTPSPAFRQLRQRTRSCVPWRECRVKAGCLPSAGSSPEAILGAPISCALFKSHPDHDPHWRQGRISPDGIFMCLESSRHLYNKYVLGEKLSHQPVRVHNVYGTRRDVNTRSLRRPCSGGRGRGMWGRGVWRSPPWLRGLPLLCRCCCQTHLPHYNYELFKKS